jgi:hypothetical protein
MCVSAISPEQAKAYLERWELVREAEVTELQRTPLAVKFRQLAALVASSGLFGGDPQRAHEIEVVRERWSRLRKALSA